MKSKLTDILDDKDSTILKPALGSLLLLLTVLFRFLSVVSSIFEWIAIFFLFLAIVFFVIMFDWKRRDLWLFERKWFFTGLFWGMTFAIIQFTILFFLIGSSSDNFLLTQMKNVDAVIQVGTVEGFIVLLLYITTIPILFELIIRGQLQESITDTTDFLPSLLVSSLLWSGIMAEWFYRSPLFNDGLGTTLFAVLFCLSSLICLSIGAGLLRHYSKSVIPGSIYILSFNIVHWLLVFTAGVSFL